MSEVSKRFHEEQGPLGHRDLVALVRALWAEPVHELHSMALSVLTKGQPVLTPSDIDLLEEMLRTSYTWAYVDHIAVHLVGGLVERNPALTSTLDRWVTDDDFWIRRSAMLALLMPLRRGEGDLARFLRYADAMLEEKEFFIRKAIGWVLRDAAKKRPAEVTAFLEPRTGRIAGLTLREAVKYLPEADRERLMGAYKAGRKRG
jgi:3-methyladenine DNA glycosylase AlkD